MPDTSFVHPRESSDALNPELVEAVTVPKSPAALRFSESLLMDRRDLNGPRESPVLLCFDGRWDQHKLVKFIDELSKLLQQFV